MPDHCQTPSESKLLAAVHAAFAALPTDRRCWVALSGGVDSLTLLALLVEWATSHPAPSIAAVHVHHGLAAAADDWAQHCAAYCRQWQVPLSVSRVTTDLSAGLGIEAAAREARYGVFSDLLEEGEVLLQAHQQDDQVETVLFRLLRGAGPLGLAGIPQSRTLGRGELRRPLLDVPREVIQSWAAARGLSPIHDPANEDRRFDRTLLRREILPRIAERWPAYRNGIARSAALQRDLVDEWREEQALFWWPVSGEPALSLTDETPKRLAGRLHRWLTLLGVRSPAHARLATFAEQALSAAPDRCPALIMAGYQLRRWRQHLFLTSECATSALPAQLRVGEVLQQSWGRLVWQPASDGGLAWGTALSLRHRQAGERVRPVGRPSRPLSRWWQECGVPPWWREHLPLLCAADGAVSAVLGAGLTESGRSLGAASTAGAPAAETADAIASGWLPVWEPPPWQFH